MRSLGFFLEETFEGIRRHSTSSLVTFLQAFISLFLLGAMLIFIIIVNNFVGNFLNNMEMAAFLDDNLAHEQVVELQEGILDLTGVREVTYVSKETAFAIMQARTTVDIDDLLYERNPFPASLKIKVTSPKRARELAGLIGQLEGINDVAYGEEQLSTILPLFYGIELTCFFLAIVLTGVTLLIILNTIRLAILSREKEIKIMQLVGATSGFIRFPFLLEGLIYGFGGAAVALGLLAIVYRTLLTYIETHYIYNPWIVDYDLMMGNLALVLFILGGLIGIIGSLIAVDKHLKKSDYKPSISAEVG